MHLYNMKHYNVQIPNPCSESWDSMTVQGNGRFCNTCEKVIRDYSKVSDSQLLYILDHSNGEICGRFNARQLNRPLAKSLHSNGPDLLAVVLGITLLMTTYSVQANEAQQYAPEVSLVQMLDDTTKQADKGHYYIIVKFQILDEETKEPIPFVKVKVLGKEENSFYNVLSDIDGIVEVNLTPDQFDAVHSVFLAALEYERVTLDWNPDWKQNDINEINLTQNWQEVELMGEVVIFDSRTKREIRKENREERRRIRQENRDNN